MFVSPNSDRGHTCSASKSERERERERDKERERKRKRKREREREGHMCSPPKIKTEPLGPNKLVLPKS